MTKGMKRDGGAVLAICKYPQRCLLGHDPRGQKEGRLFAEQGRDLGLEFGDDTAVAIKIHLGVIRNLCEQGGDGAWPITHEVPITLLGKLGE